MTNSAAPARLLLIEDNEITREGMCAVLRQAGFEVVPSADGRQALDFLAAGEQPDLMLLDMLMPGVDGWAVLKEVRAQDYRFPVLIVTGSILTKEWALSHGCPGFLHKPIETDALLNEVNRLLRH